MRLIDADALLKHEVEADRMGAMLVVGKGYILDAPTIEAAPVVHGEWVKSDDYKGWLVCSACRDCYVDNAWVNGKKWRYCPNCGSYNGGDNA